MAMYHGQGNSGPAREVWRLGDRVKLMGCNVRGTVSAPPDDRERNVFQTGWVWVRWDDGEATWAEPGGLDIIL